MKTVLFVPGYQEDLNSRDYDATIKAIESKGYKIKFVPITWKRTTIDNWLEELETEYSKHDPKNTILAGFSFGAMTAFVAASRKNPSELWLCSLSSYFNEDNASPSQKKSWLTNLGHRRVSAFDALNFKELSSKIHCKTLLFYGQRELDKWPVMNERAIGAQKLLKNNLYLPVPDVGHDVADEKYILKIRQSI